MQWIPLIYLIVNWKREKLDTAVLVPEFRAANSALCDLHVIRLGPGFHCSNGSTLSRTKSVGLCVVMEEQRVPLRVFRHYVVFLHFFKRSSRSQFLAETKRFVRKESHFKFFLDYANYLERKLLSTCNVFLVITKSLIFRPQSSKLA